MVIIISLLLVAQGVVTTSGSRWASEDALVEDSLGDYVDFAVDYNYSNGDMYVACIPDSGTYFGPDFWGLLVFHFTDHGESGGVIIADSFLAAGTIGKEIDLVATRSDTIYALVSWYDKIQGYDEMRIAKIYEAGASWTITWIGPTIAAAEILSPKLERDDFDDFYLYMAYLDITAGNDSLYILRSADRGYNWSILVKGNTPADWQDQDIAVADSSLYHLSTFQYFNNQTLQLSYWRDRGNPSTCKVKNPISVNTNLAGQIHYPRIGATTTVPDTGQLVYAFYSQEDSISGDYNLLYLYSEEGGDDWPFGPDTLIPNTLLTGSFSPVLCDLRGYQVEPNEYMDIVFCITSSGPYFENTWLWTSEGNPTNWQGTTSVATGANRSMPELIYSPGASGSGAGVFYNDSLGNLWLDAPWLLSGIAENLNDNKDKIRSQIVFAGSIVEIGSTGATVYDVTGRAITKLNGSSWNLTDGEGGDIKPGIYLIVNEGTGERVKLSVIK